MEENCVVDATDPSQQHSCLEFEYFDCEDRLDITIFQTIENTYGVKQKLPVGAKKEFSFPDWENIRVCESSLDLEMCGESGCPRYCLALNEASVIQGEMHVCATLSILGHSEMFPYAFCQTIGFTECGTKNYFYPPCEHLFSSTVYWDGIYLGSIDTAAISTLPYEFYQAPESLCVFIHNTTSDSVYPFECISILSDTCGDNANLILVARGYTQFTTRVNKDGSYCFGGPNEDDFFCATFHELHYDQKLRELISRVELSYSNTQINDENTVSVVFNETSLHYPACGAIKCSPGHHVPLNWEVIEEEETNENVDYEPDVIEMNETTHKVKSHKKSSHTTLIWSLSIVGGVVIIAVVATVLSILFVFGRNFAKRNVLLEEDEEYEMVEMKGAAAFSYPDEDTLDDDADYDIDSGDYESSEEHRDSLSEHSDD
eukprot:CAMPEP_0206199334 /NCGR_PEP_ID=MMETSP0166-20121206/10205_1 /ASSEMBLY_ACC=CAM_ASM_000260 /TAXON_ID=95228 /ORGANISM="Vannella robusta, Strain DIVA3 518/3/11/1/6" /LENGTH=429 /DNA_ID=CAMNT_0053617427 /DNA_START=243 /DNA_END=1532 /DNA_ORIENTATION=-